MNLNICFGASGKQVTFIKKPNLMINWKNMSMRKRAQNIRGTPFILQAHSVRLTVVSFSGVGSLCGAQQQHSTQSISSEICYLKWN